jgi:hypothetical protein
MADFLIRNQLPEDSSHDQAQLHSDRSGIRVGQRSCGSGAIRRRCRGRRCCGRRVTIDLGSIDVVSVKHVTVVLDTIDVVSVEYVTVILVPIDVVLVEHVPIVLDTIEFVAVDVIQLVPIDLIPIEVRISVPVYFVPVELVANNVVAIDLVPISLVAIELVANHIPIDLVAAVHELAQNSRRPVRDGTGHSDQAIQPLGGHGGPNIPNCANTAVEQLANDARFIDNIQLAVGSSAAVVRR